MLQSVHRFGIEQMMLAFAAPLVLATQFKFAMDALIRSTWVSNAMTCCHFCTHLLEPYSINSRNSSRKELVNQRLTQSNCFKDLCTGV